MKIIEEYEINWDEKGLTFAREGGDLPTALAEKLLDTARDRGQTLHEFIIEVLTAAVLPNGE